MKSKFYLFALVLSLFAGCGGKDQTKQKQVSEYAVITLGPASVDLNKSYPATIRGKQDIEIRPQVSGFITKLCVDEGSVVRKGQTLFVVDPVQYEAAVNSARAAVDVAKANVETAKLTAANKKELQKKNIISEYDLQMAENTLASQKAMLAQAEAQLVNAQKNLSFTNVVSPSDGVVGVIPFRLGSLVSPSITTPMTTVSDISEMYVYFSMTEKQLLELTRQNGAVNDIIAQMPAVQLRLADGSVYNEKGKIETLSGVIDQSTGAVSMRASFPNPKQLLRSGGTGSVLVPYTDSVAILIPQKATYEIQDKKFVYVMQNDSTVKNMEITIFNLNDGKHYVVTDGLKIGDKIVVEGVASLRDGTPIKAITPEESAAKIEAMRQMSAGGAKK